MWFIIALRLKSGMRSRRDMLGNEKIKRAGKRRRNRL